MSKTRKTKVQADKLGLSPEEYSVTAATDAAGAQVIVIDETQPATNTKRLHLLSQSFENHAAAVEFGESVVEKGVDIYDKWYDFRKPGEDLFALMMNMLR